MCQWKLFFSDDDIVLFIWGVDLFRGCFCHGELPELFVVTSITDVWYRETVCLCVVVSETSVFFLASTMKRKEKSCFGRTLVRWIHSTDFFIATEGVCYPIIVSADYCFFQSGKNKRKKSQVTLERRRFFSLSKHGQHHILLFSSPKKSARATAAALTTTTLDLAPSDTAGLT